MDGLLAFIAFSYWYIVAPMECMVSMPKGKIKRVEQALSDISCDLFFSFGGCTLTFEGAMVIVKRLPDR